MECVNCKCYVESKFKCNVSVSILPVNEDCKPRKTINDLNNMW